MLSSLTDKVINAIGETHYKRWMSRGGEEYMLEFASEWCSRSQYLRACKEMYVCRNMLEKIAGHLNGASLPYDSNMLAVERMFKNYLAEQIVVKTCVTSFVDQYIDSEDFEVIEHLVKLGVLIVDDTEDLSEVSSLSSEPDASDDCSINISKPDAFDLICIETIEGEHFNSVCNLPLFPEDDNSFSNKIVDCSNLKPNPLLCIEEENENENRECVLFEKAVISFPPNKENNGSRIISFPFVVNEKCTPNIQILSSTPVYVMPQYVYDLFSSYIDTVFLDISTLFTKEFLDAGLDEKRMCRSLGEIFDLHRKDDLLLVGGVRGARGRRGGNRRGPKRRVNKKRGKRKGGRRRNVLGVIQPGRFMPDRFFATLRYDDQQYNRTLTAGVSNWFFQNSPYEPDPTSGTTNVVPGFTDLNAMYNRWKVHKIIMHYTLTCNNTDPIFFLLHGLQMLHQVLVH